MGLRGTQTPRLSKKSRKARKMVPMFLGLIGREFDFGKDNTGLFIENSLHSRNQRRRKGRKARAVQNRFAFCEFGTRVPVSHNKSNKVGHIFSVSASKSPQKSELVQEMGDRPLNVNNKQDRQRLRRIKQNLEALQKMAKSRESRGLADPFKLYKELPGSGVNLYTKDDIMIPAGGDIVIPLAPKNPGELKDKVWIAHPAVDKVNGINFQRHNHLQVISTIIDKNVSRRRTICVQNISITYSSEISVLKPQYVKISLKRISSINKFSCIRSLRARVPTKYTKISESVSSLRRSVLRV